MLERTDRQLLEASCQGEPEAFGLLQQRYQKKVHALLWRLTGQPEVSRDLQQEAWTRAFADRGNFGGRSKVSTWLFAIALNLARNWKRDRKKSFSIDAPGDAAGGGRSWGELLEDKGLSAVDRLIEEQQKERLRQALARLPGAYREVVVLHFLEELDYEETARLMSKTQPHVRLLVTRALRRLHKEMEG